MFFQLGSGCCRITDLKILSCDFTMIFNYIKNPTGYIFDTISGFNVLGIHGEVKNMEQAIKNFSHTYKVPIDVLIAGHLHHTRSETIGVNRDVINVPSIIGVDDLMTGECHGDMTAFQVLRLLEDSDQEKP